MSVNPGLNEVAFEKKSEIFPKKGISVRKLPEVSPATAATVEDTLSVSGIPTIPFTNKFNTNTY